MPNLKRNLERSLGRHADHYMQGLFAAEPHLLGREYHKTFWNTNVSKIPQENLWKSLVASNVWRITPTILSRLPVAVDETEPDEVHAARIKSKFHSTIKDR